MVATNSEALASRIRTLRGHGITSDFRKREAAGTWESDQVELGFNYRISDINCALGRSQLKKQRAWVETRRSIAARYRQGLADIASLDMQEEPEGCQSSYHLFPVRITGEDAATMRRGVFATMRGEGIGVNVHYRPVYLNSYYANLGYERGLCPTAEAVYDGLLSLPMWPGLDEQAQDRVISSLRNALGVDGKRAP